MSTFSSRVVDPEQPRPGPAAGYGAQKSGGAVRIDHALTPGGAPGDRLLRTISRIAELLLTTHDWERKIEQGLAELGQAIGVSRAYIFENHVGDDGALLTNQRYEWLADGVESGNAGILLEDVPLGGEFARWVPILEAGDVVQGPVGEFPEGEQAYLVPQGIWSLLIVPIFTGTHWWGFMGFDECQRERVWSADDTEALRSAAGIFGGAIRHQRTASALQQSEERYRRLIEQSPDGIVVHRCGEILYVNAAALRLLREKRVEQVVGRSVFDVVDPTDHDRVRRHLAGERPSDIEPAELRVVRTDGHLVPVEVTAVRIHFDGAPASQLVIRDITIRKRAEQSARELIGEQAARTAAEAAERRARFLAEAGTILASSLDYRTTLRSVARLAISALADSCIIYILDPNGRVQRIEAAHADPEQEKVLWEILAHDPPDPAAPRSPIARVMRSGEAEIIRAIEPDWYLFPGADPEHLDRCRRVMPRSLICVPLVMQGRVGGAISFGSATPGRLFGDADLVLATELAARAAIAVDKARLFFEAQQASQAKTEFMAVMSHELKTPLTAITTYAELLRADATAALSDAQRKQLDVIAANSFHLAQLIDEVLSYTRTESERVEVAREVIDTGVMTSELIEWVRPQAESKGLGLSLHLRAEPGAAVVNTDATRLKQILVNLLTNAVRFTDQGGIEVSVEAEAERVWIRVTDSGIGIAPEHHEQVWEPFWQVDRSFTRRVSGTGLGLSIVQRLSRLLGGDVELRSEVGQGSTFSMWLPRLQR